MPVFAGLYTSKVGDHVSGTPADHLVGPIGIVSQVGRVESIWRL